MTHILSITSNINAFYLWFANIVTIAWSVTGVESVFRLVLIVATTVLTVLKIIERFKKPKEENNSSK